MIRENDKKDNLLTSIAPATYDFKQLNINKVSALGVPLPKEIKDRKCTYTSSFELSSILSNSNPVLLNDEDYLLISGKFL
jgi:hypothetical protein